MSPRKIAVLTFAAAGLLACDHDPLTVESAREFAPRARNAVVEQSRGAVQLPFHGSFTIETSSAFTPPTTLTLNGTANGHAIQLGQFTAASVDVVNTATSTSTGTFTLTAADGDQLFSTTTGAETEFVPPNVSHITLVATIVGGTGRFAAATGTFTVNSVVAIDFASGTSSGSGSFDGLIDLNKK
ncbi:MAG TPA: hypothetical protein VGD27_13290 [Longimicrobiales bacterium]